MVTLFLCCNLKKNSEDIKDNYNDSKYHYPDH